MINPLFWFVPGAPGEHVLSLVGLSALASWSWHRYRFWGLVIPTFLVCASEAQFQILVLGVFNGPFVDWLFLPIFPGITIIYAARFRRVPWFMFAVFYGALLLDVYDGFRISYGFPAGSPYLYDPYTNAKEILWWNLAALAAWWDNR